MMNRLYLILALALCPIPAMAQYVFNGLPCNSATNGTTEIVARPPTAAEIAAVPSQAPFPPLILKMEFDSITCSNPNWTLNSTTPQYGH